MTTSNVIQAQHRFLSDAESARSTYEPMGERQRKLCLEVIGELNKRLSQNEALTPRSDHARYSLTRDTDILLVTLDDWQGNRIKQVAICEGEAAVFETLERILITVTEI